MIEATPIDDYVCAPAISVREVLARINAVSPELFQVVIDAEGRVLGTLTDGDIRRAMLSGLDLESRVSDAMHTPPILGHVDNEANNRNKLRGSKFLPVVDDENRLRRILLDLPETGSVTRALVLAGGFGRRLGEETRATPKPLLPVGKKPILDHVLVQLEEAGVTSIDIAVHYLADQVEEFISSRKSTAEITLVREKRPMGTAGSLGLLPKAPAEPLFVVNGDVVCQVDFRALNEFHLRHKNDGTIAVAQYEVSVPYGVIEQGSDGEFAGIREKPVFNHFVAAGIYCLSPEYCALVQDDRPIDMPDLLAMGRKAGLQAGLFVVHEYWKDIGRPADLADARTDVTKPDFKVET